MQAADIESCVESASEIESFQQSLPAKRARTVNVRLADYETAVIPLPVLAPAARAYRSPSTVLASVSAQSVGPNADAVLTNSAPNLNSDRTEALQMYMDLLDDFSNELDKRFGALQSNISLAIGATNPLSDSFMDKTLLQPLADLAGLKLDDAEVELARRFFGQRKDVFRDAKSVAHSPILETMPCVSCVIELSRTVAVSTAVCESSFSCLKRVLTPHRMSMIHKRKADLILISFERQIARKVQADGQLVRRFWDSGPDGRRRLQLF